ncbi:MAG: hypothetical protein J7M19_08480 [Planctomycetes bacterium]|nr:hypothetical protein [Planctomycetota bacterium]
MKLHKVPGIALLFVLVVCGGCVELGRRPVTLKPGFGEPLGHRKPRIAVSIPQPQGLAGWTAGDDDVYYRTSKTDSLVRIAEKFYGDRRYSREIYLVNEDVISSAGGLRRGLVIVLPGAGDKEALSR